MGKTMTNFYYISNDGIALDDYGHEVRDEQGQIIIVPPEERHFYDIAFRPEENPENFLK
jgi:hypothetical protein